MQLEKAPVETAFTHVLAFDEVHGIVAITVQAMDMTTSLGYQLTRDEARQLAAALTTWADSQP